MCIQRLRFAQEKQQALAKQDRRDVAKLLADGKEQKAHYRVESLINDDIHNELLELLELYCELLHARVSILVSIQDEEILISEHMNDGINEAVRSIVYATVHCPEVKELTQMKELLALKFGQEFLSLIVEDRVGVPEKVLRKCSPTLPSQDLVTLYLKEIARTYAVTFSELEQEETEEESSDGGSKAVDSGKAGKEDEKKPIVAVDNDERFTEDAEHPISVRKPKKNSETVENDLKIPKAIKKDVKIIRKKPEEDNLDELRKRFAALRR
ncbi:hypothetical protein HG536_0B01060 [Torulaspora globosa]|uniref:Vacuolar protein sorting-associated protein IST1 n=1 Tax=Torulaspora globosa TaxID=48254 RepID=A0A7G3ZCK9_9SACH|nr:uncharacterized protein HG536_0B01060 [Torulaspora globosa]QLL31245.1 hypothetical protein HG536_0B01060 [Torulaspora globosa]